MKIYGLTGFPLSHTYSPKYFSEKFKLEEIPDAVYQLFPLKKIEDIVKLANTVKEMRGLNVTIPHKETIIEHLNELDTSAKVVEAVNTVKIERRAGEAYLIGFNTDITGFEVALKQQLQPHHKNALILGTGGSSKAVQYVLQKLEINALSVSRKPEENEIGYGEIDQEIIQKHPLIINTTPLGMYPDIFKFPDLPYNAITSDHLLFDLIYNPPRTEFMKRGSAMQANVCNGLEMLKTQAEKSWEIWNS